MEVADLVIPKILQIFGSFAIRIQEFNCEATTTFKSWTLQSATSIAD